jgi:hypothetical protein
VAVQAVVVGVLMVIVFVTLLRPESNGPLFGVQAPALPDSAALPSPGSYVGANRHPNGGGRHTGAGVVPTAPGGATITAPATAGVTAPGTTGGSTDTGAGSAGGGGQGSPTDDQYADTLTRLAARLN